MRSLKLLSAILVLAALSGCEEKKPRYLDDGKDKTGAKILASGAFIPPVSSSPQGAWRVTHIDGRPFDGGGIAFAKGWVSYSGGCNGAIGEFVSHPDGRFETKDMSGHAEGCMDADGGTSGLALDALIGERLGGAVKFQLPTPDELLLTPLDKRSLRMTRLPRPPRSIDGDWALLNAGWDPRRGSDPRATARFHRGRYQDAVGCAGRFWRAFGVLAVTLENTSACARSKLISGFHRIRSTYQGWAFVPREDYRYMILAPLSNWEVVPRSRWALEGLWYGAIDEPRRERLSYRLAFTAGQVTQWDNCQGDITRSGDRLTLVFPKCVLRPKMPYWLNRTQLPAGATTATLKMRSYGDASLALADGRVLWLYRAEPKERR